MIMAQNVKFNGLFVVSSQNGFEHKQRKDKAKGNLAKLKFYACFQIRWMTKTEDKGLEASQQSSETLQSSANFSLDGNPRLLIY